MKYALNLEPETRDDYFEFDAFEEESMDGFGELDEFTDPECESCSEFDPEYDESEWEAEVMRGRRVPQRPLRTRPIRIRPGMRRPRFRPRVIRRPGQVIAGPSVCTCPAPDCPRHGSEYVRWVQSALNLIMNLQLPVTGIMNAPTRSALRSFQEKQGLPVDGIAGPETKDALIGAKGGKSPGADATKSAEPGMMEPTEPASMSPAAEFDFEWEAIKVLECEPDLVIIDGFVVGDYRLLPSHYGKLMKLLEKARNSAAADVPVSLGLTGHTDNSGLERMNTGLSLSRAHEVQTFFIRQGVQVHDVSGEGELRPRFPNTTRANKSRNRRVEILVCVAPSPALRRPSSAGQNEYEWEAQEPATEFDFEWEGWPEPEIDELVGDFEYQPTPWGPTPGTEWPKGRTFKPDAPSIPSGPYSLPQMRKCGVVADVNQLSNEIQRFEKLILELRRRRNEPASPELEEIRAKANRKFNDVTTLINVVIADVKNGNYRRGGCGGRDFAIATCKMRMLGGFWCKSPSLKKARCNLVFLLHNSRGKFANVSCTKLGVTLAKDWCKGHTCCCPGVG